jgi:hypothetical protein
MIYIFSGSQSGISPDSCDQDEIRKHIEELVILLSEGNVVLNPLLLTDRSKVAVVPGKRYASTLQFMLKRTKKRMSRSPQALNQPPLLPPIPMAHPQQQNTVLTHAPAYAPYSHHPDDMSPYEGPYPQPFVSHGPGIAHIMPVSSADIYRDSTANDQLPFWISDQSLGGYSMQQFGMDAFLLPQEHIHQIW